MQSSLDIKHSFGIDCKYITEGGRRIMKNIHIEIHYDFTDGTELSYGEAILAKEGGFTTNCLDFFSTDNPYAVVTRRDGKSIIVADLLEGKGGHTEKEIRAPHNIRKMLIAGALKFT